MCACYNNIIHCSYIQHTAHVMVVINRPPRQSQQTTCNANEQTLRQLSCYQPVVQLKLASEHNFRSIFHQNTAQLIPALSRTRQTKIYWVAAAQSTVSNKLLVSVLCRTSRQFVPTSNHLHPPCSPQSTLRIQLQLHFAAWLHSQLY